MPTDAEARAEVLRRVGRALGGGEPRSREAAAKAWEELPRTYLRKATRTREEIVSLLEDRLRDYDAHVERVGRGEMVGAILRRVAEKGMPRMVVPAGLDFEMGAEGSFTEDRDFSHEELDGFGGVLTTATVGIALTGTLVLQNVPGQGRRAATLIPDYHVCVLRVDDVVETVPEAMARLARTTHVATTFISGPSATADIEMTRIKGVHGPRVLDVLLMDESL